MYPTTDEQRKTNIKQIISLAAELLETGKVGWTQNHAFVDEKGVVTEGFDCGYESVGACCALGAIELANFKLGLHYDASAQQALYDAMEKMSGRRQGVASWNDDPNRTKDEVVNFLKFAASNI